MSDRRRRPSQADRLLAILKTGPKTHAELYAANVGVVHSRAAELRRRGYRIACDPPRRGGKPYVYRIVAGAASEPHQLMESSGSPANDASTDVAHDPSCGDRADASPRAAEGCCAACGRTLEPFTGICARCALAPSLPDLFDDELVMLGEAEAS